MNDDDLNDDLAELFNDSPEDQFLTVKDRLEALTVEFHTKGFRIEEDIFNAGLDIIKNGIFVIYCALHEEH